MIHISGGTDLTLDEVSKIGELVTEALDPEANVIWGARIDEAMKGKLRVMTIVTGVNSPYVLGRTHYNKLKLATKVPELNEELGIDMVFPK